MLLGGKNNVFGKRVHACVLCIRIAHVFITYNDIFVIKKVFRFFAGEYIPY